MRTAPILSFTRVIILLTTISAVSCRRNSNSAAPITPGAPIDSSAPLLSLYHPTATSLGVATNSSLFLQFSEDMDLATLDGNAIQLAKNAAAVPGTIQAIAANAVLFTPLTNLEPNTLYLATVTSAARDLAGNFFSGPFSWSFATGSSVDLLAPSVALTLPGNGESNVPYNLQAITAVFSEAMNPGTIGSASFTLETGGVPVPGTANAVGTGIASFTPASPLAALTNYTATVASSVTDLAGNPMGANYSWSFTTGLGPDSVAPSVVLTNPEGGMGGIPINTAAISLAFSEPMDGATITGATFTVELAGAPIPGSVLFSGNTAAVFAPSAALQPLASYTAKIASGVKDLAGNALGAPFTWTFTTGAGPDLTAPGLLLTTPASFETNVGLNATVHAIFNEGIDPLSVNAASFSLSKNLLPVAGTVSFSGNSLAQFTPSAPFVLLGRYTANLSDAIEDLSGNSFPATNWTFTARDGDWMAPEILGASPSGAKFDLGQDANGNAFAIWQRDDGPAIDDHIFVRRFDANTASWSSAAQLDTAPTSAINPRIAVQGAGNAFAIWEQNDGTPNYRVVMRRYDGGTSSWGPANTLFTNTLTTRACMPQIAVDAAGNAFAGWIGNNLAGQSSLYVARYDAGSASWAAGVLMESATDPVTMFRIVSNATGDALLVFGQGPGSTAKNLYGRRYQASSATWSTAAPLDLGAGAISSPTVAIDPTGNGIAIWIQKNTNFATFANRFDGFSSTWQGETSLDSGNVAAIPSISMDAAGNALASWESGTPLTFVKVRRYDRLAANWSALVAVSDNSGNSSTPSVALDPEGNGVVLWSQRDGVQNNILGTRYSAANDSFGPAVFVENAPRSATNPIVFLGGPQHKGVAVWKQLNATISDLWANRFE